jgi:predicted alpha/beta-hydrolase family hydrolase
MAARSVRTSVHIVSTPVGDARVHVSGVTRPRAIVVLGHGAGRGTDTADLLGLARELPTSGVSVVLVDQPWVLAGRRVAAPPPTLDVAWVAVLAALREPPLRAATGATRKTPLVVGGRSAGARVAARTAAAVSADSELLLAVPLIPPAARRTPEAFDKARALRLPELLAPGAADIPVVVAQGARDPFGSALEVAEPSGLDVVTVAEADHSFGVRRGGPDPLPTLLAAALRSVEAARDRRTVTDDRHRSR